MVPAVIGSALTLVLVNVFPARRTRDILSLIALAPPAGWCCCSGCCGPSSSRGRRDSATWSSSSRCCARRAAAAAERVGSGALMNWLLRVAGSAAPRCCSGPLRRRFIVIGAPLHRRLYLTVQQGAGGRQHRRRPGAWHRRDRTLLGWLPVDPARVRAQGHPGVLPRHDPVDPADPARGARGRVRLQHRALPLYTGEGFRFFIVTWCRS